MKLLNELYRISAPSGKEFEMVDFIDQELQRLGAETWRDESNNLYAVKGECDTYPCIVAHTDEVHDKKPIGFEVFSVGNMLIGIDTIANKHIGIGADDKNGIWVALKAFERFDILKGAFFVSEEVGCIGSSFADMSFFEDCRFVLQCDRKGSSDFISEAAGVELNTAAFVEDANIDWFGFRDTAGSVTDVMQLKLNGLKVCAANISCGYYNPHQDTEYTVFYELENTLYLVSHIIATMTDVYPHEYVEKYYKWGKSSKGKNKYDTYSMLDDPYSKEWDTRMRISDDISMVLLSYEYDDDYADAILEEYYLKLTTDKEQELFAEEYESLTGTPYRLIHS